MSNILRIFALNLGITLTDVIMMVVGWIVIIFTIKGLEKLIDKFNKKDKI